MSRTLLKFSSIVILAQAILTVISGVILAAGSSAFNGTEYESLIGATIALAMIAIAESVFRGITAVVGLKSCKAGNLMKVSFILGIIMAALDAVGLINALLSGTKSAPASLIAVAMSCLYLYAVIRIRREIAQES